MTTPTGFYWWHKINAQAMISFLVDCVIFFTGYTDLRIYISTAPDFFSCVFLHTLRICSTSSSSFKTTSLGPLPLLLLEAASASSSFVLHRSASVQPEVGSCREAGKWALSAPPGLSIWWVQRSRKRRSHKLDTNLCQDLCQELTSKLGVHGKSLHFYPLLLPPIQYLSAGAFCAPRLGTSLSFGSVFSELHAYEFQELGGKARLWCWLRNFWRYHCYVLSPGSGVIQENSEKCKKISWWAD